MYLRIFHIIILFLCCNYAWPQKQHQKYIVTYKGVIGTHLYQDQGHLLQDNIFGAELGISKDLRKNPANWVRQSGAKSFGIDFIFRDLSNLEGPSDTSANSFGQIYGAALNINFQLFKVGILSFDFKPAVGLAYTNKYYFNNSRNRILGSPFNEIIKADLGATIKLDQITSLMIGFDFLHASNGGSAIPNGGLNTGNIYFGFKIAPATPAQNNSTNTYQSLNRNSFEFSAGLGKRGVYEQRKKSLYRNGFFAGYNYFISDLISLKGGIDAVYYHQIYDPADNLNTFQYYGSSFDKWRLGLSLGADVNFWRFAINAQLGKYIHYNRLFEDASWYWTFGPTYNITPHFGLQVKTYMHFAQADYLNYGMVFRY